MISLIEHIEYLMMHHDCVVVPGWGALIAQYSPSHYDAPRRVVARPQRQLSFNAAVCHNDGLLAHSLMRRHGLSYDEAVSTIANHVTSLKKQLEMGGEVSFGRLGYFQATEGGQAEFMPYYHDTSNDEYFGLRSVHFCPLAELLAEQDAAQSTRSHVLGDRNQFLRQVARVAASIIVLLGLAIVLTTPVLHNGDQQLAGLHMPVTKATVEQQATPALTQNTQQEQQVVAATTQGQFMLVIATLSSKRQVKAFKQAHPDMASKMQVQKRGKIYRVYVQRGNDRDVLETARQQLSAQFADAWVTAE